MTHQYCCTNSDGSPSPCKHVKPVMPAPMGCSNPTCRHAERKQAGERGWWFCGQVDKKLAKLYVRLYR